MAYNNKKIIRCIMCTGIYLFLVIVGYRYLSNKMELKNSHIKYADFFENGDNVDVLFLGASHMINAVFPDQLWKYYGITSYNLANHGELLPTTYEVLRNALDYSDPQVVVVDMFTVSQMGAYYNKSFSHVSLDAFPLSRTKLNSINSLFDDIDIKCEFISNFCLYHTRWDEYLSLSSEYIPSVMKGAEMRINVESSVGGVLTESNIVEMTMTDGIKTVIKLKNLCDEKGIDLICVNIPYSGFEERDAIINYAADYMKEAGIIYLDFRSEESELQLDPKTDFYDFHHLNPLGGRKVTEYLGRYLIENCGVQNKKNSECAEQWNQDVKLSTAERMQQLKKQAEDGNIINTLMMIKANKVRSIIVITPYIFFRDQDVIKDILCQMGFDVSEIDNFEVNSVWVGIYDEENGISYGKLVEESRDFYLTDFIKKGDSFLMENKGYNYFCCTYGDTGKIYIHNQMMMIYLFDDEGNLLIEKGFGTS